jgi:histidine triad (HIT) family protein
LAEHRDWSGIWSNAMTSANSCVFCSIIRGELPARVVYEDAGHIAFFPLEHINPGHVVLIPKQHTDYLFDLDPVLYHDLWATVARIAPALRDATSARRVGVAVEGFHVPHAHVHLVPINAADELNPTRAKPLEAAEADRLHAAVRTALNRQD